MAKGTDGEEFELLSETEPQSGLKNDVALALNIQSESPGSLFRKIPESNPPIKFFLEYSRKRFKKTAGNNESKNNVVNSLCKENNLDSKETNVVNSSSKEDYFNDNVRSNVEKPLVGEESESELLEKPSLVATNNNRLSAPCEVELGMMETDNNSLNAPIEENLVTVMTNSNSLKAPTEEEPGSSLVGSQVHVEEAETNLFDTPSTMQSQKDLIVSEIAEETKSTVAKVLKGEAPFTRRLTRSALEAPRELVICLKSSTAIKETSRSHMASTRKPLKPKRSMWSASKSEADPTVIDSNGEVHNVLMEQPLQVYIPSDSKLKVPNMLVIDNSEAHEADPRHCTTSELENDTVPLPMNDNNDSQVAPKVGDSSNYGCSGKEEANTETPIVIYDCNVAHDVSEKRTPRRFTRSSLKFAADTVLLQMNDKNNSPEAPKIGYSNNNGSSREEEAKNRTTLVVYDGNVEKDSSNRKTLRRFTRSALKSVAEPMAIDGTRMVHNSLDSKVEHMMIGNNVEAQEASPVKPSKRSRLSRCMTEQSVIDDNSKVHNTSLETPPRRFTRSALVSKKEVDMVDENGNKQNTSLEKPLRRFTRSNRTLKDETTGVTSPIGTPLHKKLELKMSKKIALTKLPTKISELLETGMLEGLSVTYMSQAQQNEALRGMIKDSGILCSCTSCNGCKVVTPKEFEQHAGSANRNAAYYIYLDNGNTLHDVINACKGEPLDMLETTIQTAIKSPSLKNSICLNCKGPLSVSKTRRTLALCNSCLEHKIGQTSRTRKRPLATPENIEDASRCISPRNSSRGKLTRKDLGLHKLVFEEGGLPDGTELGYYVRGKKLIEGYKKGYGIFCFCCNSEVSPSQFEAHAGWATRRKPYLHIYTSNGVSLHELSISLSKGRRLSAKDNDDLCGICANDGVLLLCDGCPRAFHKVCVGETSVPRGKWYCPYCQNMHKDQSCASNANAVAAGRVSGVDPIEQITKRCIRIVKTPEPEVGGCTLCRVPGFSKSRFGPRTIILCDQCEKEFHVGCLKDHNMGDLEQLPTGKWFCGGDCSRINSVLQKCILRGPEDLPESITKMIKMKRKETDSNLDISWRLLNGKIASPESRSLLSKAVAIFHNRFDPIVDALTGRDLIPCMVYGRTIRDQDFGGMFCAVVTVNSSVVSAGLLRIFGKEVAELPLVATSSDYQGQGYFQALFSCIERLLGFLNVKNLVLPAAEEAEAIWTEKFGFQKMSRDEMTAYTKDYQMTVFRETPILHKFVPKCRIVTKPTEDS